MGLETASYVSQLQPANPSATDRLQQGDDHIRLLKQVLKNTFPNITGPITLTQAAINALPASTVPTGLISVWYGAPDKVPSGWALCDGSAPARSDGSGTIQTPDLRGRVVVGVSDAFPFGATGGATQRSLTTNASGNHTHAGSTGAAGAHDHGGQTGSTALSASQIPAHTHSMAANVAIDTDLTSGPDGSVAWRTTSAPGESEYSLRSAGSTPATLGRTSPVGNGEGHRHTIDAVGDHTHALGIGEAGGHTHTIETFSTMPPYGSLHYIMKI